MATASNTLNRRLRGLMYTSGFALQPTYAIMFHRIFSVYLTQRIFFVYLWDWMEVCFVPRLCLMIK